MSKKINSFGKCLALTAFWYQEFQFYGKNFSLFKKFFFLVYLIRKLIIKKNLFYLSSFIFLNIKFNISKKKLNLMLSIYKLSNSFNFFSQFFFPIWIQQNNCFLPLNIKIFVVENFFFSNFFFKNLIFYLLLKNKYNLKKIFNYFFQLLKNNVNSLLIKNSKKGTYKKKLLGFKIQLKGRFEITKNSMSKKTFIKSGKLSSTSLLNYTIFYEHVFFSKLGLSNFKIWLFYNFV